jgi:hypothetical protein
LDRSWWIQGKKGGDRQLVFDRNRKVSMQLSKRPMPDVPRPGRTGAARRRLKLQAIEQAFAGQRWKRLPARKEGRLSSWPT